MADPTEKQWFTDREAGKRFGVSRETWRRWARIGHAPQPVKVGPGTTRWHADDLEAFARKIGVAA